jgi:hypothetical protein
MLPGPFLFESLSRGPRVVATGIRNEPFGRLLIADDVLALRRHPLDVREPSRSARRLRGSKRADVCNSRRRMPCACNPCGGIDEPPAKSPIARVMVSCSDEKGGPAGNRVRCSESALMELAGPVGHRSAPNHSARIVVRPRRSRKC